jgi:titin
MVASLGRTPVRRSGGPRRHRQSALAVLGGAAVLLLSMAGTTPVRASGGTFTVSWSPSSPTFVTPVTITVSISGCGALNTTVPVMFYDVEGLQPTPWSRTGQLTTSLTNGGDGAVGAALIGTPPPGSYVVYGIANAGGGCFSTHRVVVATMIVLGPPGAPASVLATDRPDGSMYVNWPAPVNNGAAITSYTVTPSPACVACTGLSSVGSPASQATSVVGLTHGTSYTFTVAATNSLGTGASSPPSPAMVSAAAPAAPSGLTAAGHPDGTVTLAWTAPTNDNGAPVTSYQLWPMQSCQCSVVSSSLVPATMTITGLFYDTPSQFSVAGINIAGTGAYAPWSNPVTIASAPPDAPSGPTAVGNPDGSVDLSWTAPAENGVTISTYTVTPTPACAGCTGLSLTGNPPSATTAISGLDLGTSYTFTVTATNALGPSIASAPSNAITPATAPGAPTLVHGSAQPDGTVDVTWVAPADNGATIISYAVTSSPACSACTGVTVTGSPAASSTTVAGLTSGTAYTFSVTATNAAGPGAASSPSNAVTPALAPGTPSGVVSTANSDGSVGLSWTAPADNGATITSYTVTPTPACGGCTGLDATGNPAGPTTALSGLALGTSYTFTVTANNGPGPSVASAPSNAVTPATAPGAPTLVHGSAQPDGTVDVTWVAPADNGATITSYAVTSSPACSACTGVTATGSPAASSTTVAGLTSGTAYTFTLTATNAVGPGVGSLPSSAVTPALAPGTPSGVMATANPDGSVGLSWTTPPDNGAAITTFTLMPAPACTSCTGLIVSGGPPPASTAVRGLTVGSSYTFTVSATNGVGTSVISDPSAAVIVTTPPGVGQVPSAIEGNGQATLTWNPSAANGSTITTYTILAAPGGATCTWTAGPLTCTVAGLNNGTPYTFTVAAVNGAGVGPASGPSAAVIPAIPALRITLSAAAATNPLGAHVTLDGTGLMPGSTATVTVHSTPTTLATVPAGSSGTFSTVITLPALLAPGGHTLTATGTAFDGSAVTARVSFVVAATSLLTPPPPIPPAPSAGASPMGGLAALLILGGALLGTATRRRHAA